MTDNSKPVCYVIGGPNGAGKTTFAMRYLPRIAACTRFVNADMIAQGLSPLDSKSVEVEAGRIFISRIDELIREQQDFAFESTLSGRTYARLFRRIRRSGFQICLFYLWIPSVSFSAARVASRVENGGHDIPTDAIERRYIKSLTNLFSLYAPLADRVLILDNSVEDASLIAEIAPDGVQIANTSIYTSIINTINEVPHEQ